MILGRGIIATGLTYRVRDSLSAFGGFVSGRQNLIPFAGLPASGGSADFIVGIPRSYFIQYRIR